MLSNGEKKGTCGPVSNSTREDKMGNEHDPSEQYHLQRSPKLCRNKPHQRQQNYNSNSYSNKDATSPPLVNGHTNHFSLKGNGCFKNGYNDGREEGKSYRKSHTSRVLVDSVTHADCSFDEDNGNSDDAVDESNGSENNDGYCVPNSNSRKVAECQTGGVKELGDRHGHDIDVNDDANTGNGNSNHDDDNDGANVGSTVENDDGGDDDGDNGYRGYDNHHHHHCARDEHSDGGVGDGNNESSGDRADVKDDGIHGKFIRDSNFDIENKNDDADDVHYNETKSSTLLIDSIVSGKSIKLATKETNFSLPVNTALDDTLRSQFSDITAGDNKGNEKPSGARAKTLLTSNENAAKFPTTSYPQGLRPWVNEAEFIDNLYNSRIPSLEVTGINQKFLARHTTDQSLQYASITGDFNLPKKSTPRAEWPMWSLPPPDASETGHRRRHSSGLYPSVVGNQTGRQSSWQFRNQPSREMYSSNFNPQEQKSFNHINPWFVSRAEAFSGLRMSDSPPATNDTISGSVLNTHATMASTYEPKLRYSANNSYGSHVNSSTYSYQSSVLPENGQECFKEPSIPNSFTENQEKNVCPIISSVSRREEQRSGPRASSLEFPDDPSLAALERKVAEACAVVERVMKEREERTKAQREAAQKKREMREQREREAREMREREERERREREERKTREREAREMREREERERREREGRERKEREERERQEREIREREERDRREQIENEGRDTRWFGGEQAPVQESPRSQCEHYQRRCLVKFPCCGIFYPCHRCHNTSGVCDTDERKANNATHVKCGVCGHEEEINEGSQHCSSCGEQMSAYFCFICKHFTGVEKNPFHCDKCGICRIHKDKSFHCDVCNVCLDKRLEGKHKCRPDSGHDECCICLEDAFSGCQILPCSHKVHKECAIAMIQNGVRNCPICRHPLFSQDSQ